MQWWMYVLLLLALASVAIYLLWGEELLTKEQRRLRKLAKEAKGARYFIIKDDKVKKIFPYSVRRVSLVNYAMYDARAEIALEEMHGSILPGVYELVQSGHDFKGVWCRTRVIGRWVVHPSS